MILIEKGRFAVRQVSEPAQIEATQALRANCFGLQQDFDSYDAQATHIAIEDRKSGTLVCCFRLKKMQGTDLPQSYAARYYGLEALQAYPGAMVELGRFCIHRDWHDPDILRLAWAALTGFVDRHDVQLLFGCSSFVGVDPAPYRDAFALLERRHLAPPRWRPQVQAPQVCRFAGAQAGFDPRRAFAAMPALLRSYLVMGAWVSDHAVVDPEMNTLHVFTGLEIAAIPEGRKRLLRALV